MNERNTNMLTYKQFHIAHAEVWIGHSENAKLTKQYVLRKITIKQQTETERRNTEEGERGRHILNAKTICFHKDDGVPKPLPLDILKSEVCRKETTHTRLKNAIEWITLMFSAIFLTSTFSMHYFDQVGIEVAAFKLFF